MNGLPTIAGVGICCLDHIISAPQVEWGDKTHVSSYLAQGGGMAATAVVACARLGADCHMFSLLGDDPIGEQIAAELVEEGVSIPEVIRIPGATSPFSFIHVDESTGERTIFHRPGAGLEWDRSMSDLCVIGDCGALLVDHCYPDLAAAAARVARSRGVPVVADVMPVEKNAELLRLVDILIAPGDFARHIGCENDLDGALDAIHGMGPPTTLITLGADGWVYSGSTGRGRGRAFQVDVVDTTGAGDAFHGAFAYGVAGGWEVERCALFASAVAAINCTRAGGRTGLPSLEQTLDFLRKQGV